MELLAPSQEIKRTLLLVTVTPVLSFGLIQEDSATVVIKLLCWSQVPEDQHALPVIKRLILLVKAIISPAFASES